MDKTSSRDSRICVTLTAGMTRLFFGLLALTAALTLTAAAYASCEWQLSPRFASYKEDFRGTEHMLLPELQGRKLRVLFVPGFLSDAIRTLKHYGMQYFDEQARYLRRNGVEAQIVGDGRIFGGPWDSEATSPQNAEFLRDIVRSEGGDRNLVLIGHSKGGLDTLYMLIKYPELRRCLYGVVTVQTPFCGSELADWALTLGPVARRAIGWMLQTLGGNPAILDQFATPNAREWLDRNAQAIGDVLSELPLITYGSSLVNKDGLLIDTPLSRPILRPGWLGALVGLPHSPYELMRAFGADVHSDGAVSLSSSVPNVGPWRLNSSIIEYGVDHMMPVTPQRTDGPEGDYDRIAMINAILRILVER